LHDRSINYREHCRVIERNIFLLGNNLFLKIFLEYFQYVISFKFSMLIEICESCLCINTAFNHASI